MTLSSLKCGEGGYISSLNINGEMRRRLQDIGFSKGEYVSCFGVSPLGDPKAYLVRNALIAVRQKEAEKIDITCN